MRLLKMSCLVVFLAPATLSLFHSRVASAQDPLSRMGERPALEEHVNQFMLAQALGSVTDSISEVFSNERKEKSSCRQRK
jgi:hypothetical protein